jgi:hypothetical protein
MIDFERVIWFFVVLLGSILGNIFSRLSRSGGTQRQGPSPFALERRLVYARLLRLADRLISLASTEKEIPSGLQDELLSVLAEIEIVASPLTREHALALGRLIHDKIFDADQPQSTPDAWEDRRRRFIQAVRKELEIDSAYPSFPQSLPEAEASNREASFGLGPRSQIPLPVALGGIGLLLAYALDGGLDGWQGFLIGFGVGVLILLYSAFSDSRLRAR